MPKIVNKTVCKAYIVGYSGCSVLVYMVTFDIGGPSDNLPKTQKETIIRAKTKAKLTGLRQSSRN